MKETIYLKNSYDYNQNTLTANKNLVELDAKYNLLDEKKNTSGFDSLTNDEKTFYNGYADARDVLNTKLSRATNNYTLKSIRRQIYNSSNDTAIVYKDESDNEITLEVDLSEEAVGMTNLAVKYKYYQAEQHNVTTFKIGDNIDIDTLK